jgi:hypothetical protein
VTFNDLEAATEQQSRLTKRLQVKLFWLWDIEEHSKKISKQMEIVALIILLDFHRRIVLISYSMIMKK